MLAALTAVIMLPLLRVFHPPGIALAMCPALLHSGAWFPVDVVLPFTLATVISSALLSCLLSSWPRYPAPLSTELAEVEQDTSTQVAPIGPVPLIPRLDWLNPLGALRQMHWHLSHSVAFSKNSRGTRDKFAIGSSE